MPLPVSSFSLFSPVCLIQAYIADKRVDSLLSSLASSLLANMPDDM